MPWGRSTRANRVRPQNRPIRPSRKWTLSIGSYEDVRCGVRSLPTRPSAGKARHVAGIVLHILLPLIIADAIFAPQVSVDPRGITKRNCLSRERNERE